MPQNIALEKQSNVGIFQNESPFSHMTLSQVDKYNLDTGKS